MKEMIRKTMYGISALALTMASMPLFAAFEAHVINVSAKIENALFVHPESLEFGTVFPQETFDSEFFITFSNSFSTRTQNRVGRVDYVIKQKPKPRPEYEEAVGAEEARTWCHDNYPATPFNPNSQDWIQYLKNCYPSLCPYLSKHPDNLPSTGTNANNDTGVSSFHDPWDPSSFALGKLVKFNSNGTTIGNDPSDTWTVDLAVPCFKGECAQDWASFVKKENPQVVNPEIYKVPPQLEHQVFGCDLWVEVTKVY